MQSIVTLCSNWVNTLRFHQRVENNKPCKSWSWRWVALWCEPSVNSEAVEARTHVWVTSCLLMPQRFSLQPVVLTVIVSEWVSVCVFCVFTLWLDRTPVPECITGRSDIINTNLTQDTLTHSQPGRCLGHRLHLRPRTPLRWKRTNLFSGN